MIVAHREQLGAEVGRRFAWLSHLATGPYAVVRPPRSMHTERTPDQPGFTARWTQERTVATILAVDLRVRLRSPNKLIRGEHAKSGRFEASPAPNGPPGSPQHDDVVHRLMGAHAERQSQYSWHGARHQVLPAGYTPGTLQRAGPAAITSQIFCSVRTSTYRCDRAVLQMHVRTNQAPC
jgi:hypothetical protein